MPFTRRDSDFLSRGTRCAGWLYMPDGAKRPPVVVMAHGFGAERSFRLSAYAEKFVEKNMAVFVFDYRCFGDSEGTPRNLVNPLMHIQDWEAALRHVRLLEGINKDKIGLWGTSFSGGHVIVVAARNPWISAIVSQVPFVDGISSLMMMDANYIMKAVVAGLRDLLRKISFRTPYYVPIVARPDTFAIMNSEDAMPGYMALVSEGSTWKNECPARILLYLPLYRPTAYAKNVKCPALMVMAEKDFGISPEAVRKCAKKMNARLVSLPVGHFEPYLGELFEKTSGMEADFLAEQLIEA